MEAGAFEAAAAAFAAARDAMPAQLPIALMVANAWRCARNVVREREALQLAFRCLDLSDAAAAYEAGTRLLTVGEADLAQRCFQATVARLPDDAAAWAALAGATRAVGDPARAWQYIERALALRATPTVMLTAGQIRHALGDLAGAHRWLAHAAEARPDHPATRLQQGMTTLLGGLCRAGWAGWEYRQLPQCPTAAQPWHGESLKDAAILVIADQGLGDLFHFLRYVPDLWQHNAARVVIACSTSAVDLLRTSGFDAVPWDALPETDFWVPLLSLPYRLGLDTEHRAEQVPYLRSDRAAPIRSVLPLANRRPRVGLAWSGNPEFLATNLRDLDRESLHEMVQWEEIEWVALQLSTADLEGCASIERPLLAGDWLATARLIDSLDAVVSVDTSLAHLTGAMNVRGFVLLPFSPDWRWGLGRNTTDWYPSLTLVRQPRPRDWKGALRQLRPLLAAI